MVLYQRTNCDSRTGRMSCRGSTLKSARVAKNGVFGLAQRDVNGTLSGAMTSDAHHNAATVVTACTSPEDDAYVMVLQNKVGLSKDLQNTLRSRELSDVTFLVGHDRRLVHGIRDVIATRCRTLHDAINAYVLSSSKVKITKMQRIKKSFSKLSLNRRHRSCQQTSTVPPCHDVPIKKIRMPIRDFDHECFQRFVDYIHCGTLVVNPQTVVGLMTVAHAYGLPEVSHACWDFALGCVESDENLQDLLESSNSYSHMQMTRELLATIRQMKDSSTLDDFLSEQQDLPP